MRALVRGFQAGGAWTENLEGNGGSGVKEDDRKKEKPQLRIKTSPGGFQELKARGNPNLGKTPRTKGKQRKSAKLKTTPKKGLCPPD